MKPDVYIDDDGDMNFDWMGHNGEYVSIMVQQDGVMSYAALFDGRKESGVSGNIKSLVPEWVQAGIAKIEKEGAA